MKADSNHIVRSYDQELSDLTFRVAKMGGLAEDLIARAFDALSKRDPALAELAIAGDQAIDRLNREVEEQTIALIAKRQPLAVDLRQVMTAMKVANDLERIGDLAKNIAKRALAVSAVQPPMQLMSGLKHMIELALNQLKAVLDAYTEQDAAKALVVWRKDSEIDAMYNSIFRELLTYMMEDPRNIGFSTHLLFGAKNIERIGDHATNIAENVYFLVTGDTLPDDRPKGDKTSETPIEHQAGELKHGRAHPDRRGRPLDRDAARIQSADRRIRDRDLGRRRRCQRRHRRADAGPAAARLDAARHFRHRTVPAAAGPTRQPGTCRSSC